MDFYFNHNNIYVDLHIRFKWIYNSHFSLQVLLWIHGTSQNYCKLHVITLTAVTEKISIKINKII